MDEKMKPVEPIATTSSPVSEKGETNAQVKVLSKDIEPVVKESKTKEIKTTSTEEEITEKDTGVIMEDASTKGKENENGHSTAAIEGKPKIAIETTNPDVVTTTNINEKENAVADNEEEEEEGEDNEEEKCETKKTPVKSNSSTSVNASSARRTSARGRKTVERYEDSDFSKEKEKEEWTVPEGKGTALRELSEIENNISRLTGSSEELKSIHRLMFGRTGKALYIKRNILAFTGLVYGDGSPKDKQIGRMRKEEMLGKFHLSFIKTIMDLLTIDRSSTTGKVTKEALIDRLLDFLEKPTKSKGTGASAVKKKKKKQSSSKSATKRSRSKSSTKKRSKSTTSSSKKKKKPVVEKEESEDDSSESESSEKELEKTPAKKAKKQTVASSTSSKTKSTPTMDDFFHSVEPRVRELIMKEIEKGSSKTMGEIKSVVKDEFGKRVVENKEWLRGIVFECFNNKAASSSSNA